MSSYLAIDGDTYQSESGASVLTYSGAIVLSNDAYAIVTAINEVSRRIINK